MADNDPTRRSLLDWLGTGTVLALGGSLLTACSADGGASTPDAGQAGELPTEPHIETGSRPDGFPPDAGGGDQSPADLPASGFPFAPGAADHRVYRTWGQRTVETQDLKKILATWRLRVDGRVKTPKVFTFADLVDLPRTDMLVDFHCVEGWSILDVPWNGVHLSRLFDQVKPLDDATHVTFHTIGGTYNESLPLSQALEPKTLLTYGINGSTLPLKHGFPLRLVIPRLLAYKSAKYVDRIELATAPTKGFWVQRGYSYEGEVPAKRLRPGKY